jgi:xeroderma pigmentosum group C-complementing protein
MVRQQRHKAHATCQLATGLIRNRYLNDPLLQVSPRATELHWSTADAFLQARLVSMVPLHLQNAFRTFSKQTHPSEAARVRLFDKALSDLLSWWYQSFEIADERGLKRRDVNEVDQELAAWSEVGAEAGSSKFPWEPRVELEQKDDTPRKKSAKSRGKAKEVEREWGPSQDNWEIVHGLPSMSKSATLLKGSRDMSAQLFTCLCRALDIPARLVFSLQPVDWRAPSAMAKKGSKKKGGLASDAGHTTDSDAGSKGKRGKASAATSGRESGAEAWEDGQGRLAYKVPQVNLRKTKQVKKRAERSPSPGESPLCSLLAIRLLTACSSQNRPRSIDRPSSGPKRGVVTRASGSPSTPTARSIAARVSWSRLAACARTSFSTSLPSRRVSAARPRLWRSQAQSPSRRLFRARCHPSLHQELQQLHRQDASALEEGHRLVRRAHPAFRAFFRVGRSLPEQANPLALS